MNQALHDYLSAHDYAAVAFGAVEWIRVWFSENGPDSPAVIGISGGKDSTVVAALCCEALGKERVFGVLMPNGTQSDIDVSRRVVSHLGIRAAEVNIRGAYEGMTASIASAVCFGPAGDALQPTRQMQINLAPRLRMSALYAVSQCLNGRVSNNGNRSERYVGYFTHFGDSAGDFAPLANLTVTEVRLVGSQLGLPDAFVQKPPSDGLTGSTDEDNLGFTYEALDAHILTGSCGDTELDGRIEHRHRTNLFKLSPAPQYRFE